MAKTYRQQYLALLAECEELRRELARRSAVVDLAGIARHMRVNRLTPQQWKQRGLLPPVDFPDIKEPLWYETTIKEQFVTQGRTRRVWYDDPDDAEPSVTGGEELAHTA